LLKDHEVGIFTEAGVLVVSGKIPAGALAALDGSFRFVTIPVTVLAANTIYRLGAHYTDDPLNIDLDDVFLDHSGSPGVSPDVTFADLAFVHGPSLAFPNGLTQPSNGGYIGPNFAYTVAAVPEPASVILFAFGAAGVIGMGWKQRKSRTTDAS
jgi:hypothetical protein